MLAFKFEVCTKSVIVKVTVQQTNRYFN